MESFWLTCCWRARYAGRIRRGQRRGTCRGDVTVLAKTLQEFEVYLPSFFLDVAVDGIILHDTDNYAGERMANLRQFIRRQGLRRERGGNDWFWHWERFPGFDWSLNWEEVQRGDQ